MNDLGSMNEKAITDFRSILEVMNYVANTTVELNENYQLNVQSTQWCSLENKRLTAKVDRVEMELQEVKSKTH